MSARHEEPRFVLTDKAKEYLAPASEPSGVGLGGLIIAAVAAAIIGASLVGGML